jgi:hypothetical protein
VGSRSLKKGEEVWRNLRKGGMDAFTGGAVICMVLRLACLLACSLIFLLGDGIEVHHFGSHKAAAAADLFRTEREESSMHCLD